MKAFDPARWRRLSAQLDELLELDAAARAERLAGLRAGDAALADELESMLARQDTIEREHFLDGEALPVPPTLVGQALGAYTIEAPLGAGGMGSVWLARRSDGRFEGRVAVKLLNLALVGRGGAERFEREGRMLARLSHPFIARLLDAGVTAAGQPYLVLEHVEGEPIDRWCDARGLPVEARLRLVLDVIAAVAHAHARLVLHRDLKPDNILVTTDGQPKLLDFGIAKLLADGQDTQPATALTQAAGRAFTPDYAAPEQVEGGELGTATDVYALGVLLWRLLGGEHPTGRPGDTPAQRLRSVVEVEPGRLSEAAARRGDGARAARLRGDLDNICAKALKKNPAERYASAAALGDDLRRHLAHEPVAAQPDRLGYRAAKFVRRHRLGVGATALVVAALGMGIVGTAWQAVEARRERDRAQALAARNEAIAEFVGTMFSEAMPAGQAKVVQQLLERAEPLATSLFAGRPESQAEVLRVLASYYTALSLPNKQLELLERARGLVERVPDRSLQARLDCDHASAAALVRPDPAAAATLQRWGGAGDVDAAVAAACLQTLARLAQNANDAAGALRHVEAARQRLQAAGVAQPRLEATLLGDRAFALHLAGRSDAADRDYDAALAALAGLGRGESFDAQRLRLDQGVVRYALGNYRGGLALFEQVLAWAERQGGEVVPPGILANRASGLESLGRWDEALDGYARTLDASRRNGFVAGEVYALVGQASVLVELGRLDEAGRRLAEATAKLDPLPPGHSSRSRHALADARLKLARGDAGGAEAAFGAIVERLEAGGAPGRGLAYALRWRAQARLARGELAAARADAERAFEIARTLQAARPVSELSGEAALVRGRVREAQGEAEAARADFALAHAQLAATIGDAHPLAVEAARRAGR